MTPSTGMHEGWTELGSYPTASAAEIDAAYLRSEGIESMVTVHCLLPGQAGMALLWVDASALRRASWLLKIPPVTDAELEYLATGKLAGPEDRA